jgi:lysophospholipase L1-like esterase
VRLSELVLGVSAAINVIALSAALIALRRRGWWRLVTRKRAERRAETEMKWGEPGTASGERVRLFRDGTLPLGEVVMLGDSLTQDAEWGELFPELSPRNRGVVNATTEDALEFVDCVVGERTRAVFVMLGTNDLRQGRSDAEILLHYARLLDRIRELSPESTVTVQSVLPSLGVSPGRLEGLNGKLSVLAADKTATWLDLGPFIPRQSGSQESEMLLVDGLHLSASGFRVWVTALSPVMAKLAAGKLRVQERRELAGGES